jgi:hypothetical protein
MRYLKMLGLAALAAMAVTAVMGAGTASAAKVCTTDVAHQGTDLCGTHGKHAKTNTTITAAGTAELTSGFTTLHCKSHVTGNIANATTGHGTIGVLDFTGCTNQEGKVCTAATTGRPWTASVAYTSGTNGTMTVSNVAGTFTCPSPFGGNVTCNYAAASASTTVTGSHTTPVVVAKGVKLAKAAGSSFLCSNEAEWHGTYHVSTPSSLAITP